MKPRQPAANDNNGPDIWTRTRLGSLMIATSPGTIAADEALPTPSELCCSRHQTHPTWSPSGS
jgi:hypothetical protein